MLTLSVCIITLNEERKLGATLNAIKDIASEIIIVDSGSSDNTVKIAQSFGAKIIYQDWLGFSNQKNLALSLATSDLILSLDADEVVTCDLVSEIIDILNKNLNDICDGYKIKRLLYIGHLPLYFGGFYPDYQLRLIKNGMGKFNGRPVHESIELNGKIGKLQNHLLHYSYENYNDFKNCHFNYAKLSAKYFFDLKFNKTKLSWYQLLLLKFDINFHPIWTFFYRYFIRMGFLDGIHGFNSNIIYALYVREKKMFLLEEIKKQIFNGANFNEK